VAAHLDRRPWPASIGRFFDFAGLSGQTGASTGPGLNLIGGSNDNQLAVLTLQKAAKATICGIQLERLLGTWHPPPRCTGQRKNRMVNPMSEITLQYLLGGVSLVAVAIPAILLLVAVIRQARARSFVIVDPEGKVLFEISAESVQRTKPDEIARLRERIRQKHDITIRAA
jgi:hypothetical protein